MTKKGFSLEESSAILASLSVGVSVEEASRNLAKALASLSVTPKTITKAEN